MKDNEKEYMTLEYHFKYFNQYQEYYLFGSIGWECWQYPQKYYINNVSSEHKYVFQYTVSGEGAITINSHTYMLKPGQAFLIECPNSIQYYRPKGVQKWEFQFIDFNIKSANIIRNIISEFGNVFTLPSDSSVMAYWEEIYQMAKNKSFENFFAASACSYNFIMKLHETLNNAPGFRRSSNYLQNCLDVIHANYGKNLTLSQLADICNLSPSYLTKIFRDNLNTTPIQYLIKHRIDVTCRMLQESNRSIEEIALQAGFNSANYFSRVFKSVVGISPKDYRKQKMMTISAQPEIQQLIVRYETME